MIKKPRTTQDLTEPYYKRIERVVEFVERAATHYDVLGIEQGATDAQINRAYQRAVTVINPLNFKTNADFPLKMQRRIDQAFQRVTKAFSVLGNYAKRCEYDGSLAARKPSESKAAESEGTCKNPNYPQHVQANVTAESDRAATADQATASDDRADNLRKSERIKLAIPARATGFDRNGAQWDEDCETLDASRTGVRLPLKKRVRPRTIVQLSLPLPLELRSHGGQEQDYTVYALVRRIEPRRNGQRVVALEFLGENPPSGYVEKPWATFRTEWTGIERRRRPREERAVRVLIEYLDEQMQALRRDEAFTENMSTDGLRIRLSATAPDFEMVNVITEGSRSGSLATLSDRYFGKDGCERLCLRFIGVSASQEQVSNREEKAARKGKRVLVADDDPPLRKVLGRILTDAGYDVLLAEDGNLAVEMAAREKPDLVIADGLMPKLHGFLACKAIKELPSPPKVIMLTGVYTRKNYAWEARDKYRADDFMTKPFELAELLACIERHLGC